MKKIENEILKKLAEHNKGALSPAEMINGIANRDEKTVHRLISKKYIEEVATEVNNHTYNFYRITEKGLAKTSWWRWIWFHSKKYIIVLSSALLGASLALGGDITFNSIRDIKEAKRLAEEVKWEIYENISDTFNNEKSFDQEETFKKLEKLDPQSSILNSSFFYWTTHSVRDQLYKTRSNSFGLLKDDVMKDVLEFYSLLYGVDENEKQLENIFIKKIPAKVETVTSITTGISKNTKGMRTIGAQAVGKIMFHYDIYDFDLQKIDSPTSSTKEILNNLSVKVNEFVKEKKSGEIINAAEVASQLKLDDPNIYNCYSSFDVCALATSHYLILKTEMVDHNIQITNGHKKM
ncbi:MAG: hypothetical protein AAB932_02780 [Patescibacteria group bacterium]